MSKKNEIWKGLPKERSGEQEATLQRQTDKDRRGQKVTGAKIDKSQLIIDDKCFPCRHWKYWEIFPQINSALDYTAIAWYAPYSRTSWFKWSWRTATQVAHNASLVIEKSRYGSYLRPFGGRDDGQCCPSREPARVNKWSVQLPAQKWKHASSKWLWQICDQTINNTSLDITWHENLADTQQENIKIKTRETFRDKSDTTQTGNSKWLSALW